MTAFNSTINEGGLAIIKAGEGLRLRAYLDIVGIPTIGYGHTPTEMGQTITESQAEQLLLSDVIHASQGVFNAIHDVPTTDNQRSAMISLTYNIGVGAFQSSTVLRMHRVSNYYLAANGFMKWNKAHLDGKLIELPGLTRRREQEKSLYLTEDAAW